MTNVNTLEHGALSNVGYCELTILMPCLNEEETIGTCVEKAVGFLRSRGIHGEVLVADNESEDRSRTIAGQLGARIVVVREKGYGSALMAGIEAARGEYVIMGDADDSYDFTRLDGFVERLRGGFDLVMGNRFKGGIERHAMPVLHRYLGNPVLSFLGRLLFESPVGDFHCGLRGFRKEAIQSLRLSTPGMEFASEMVVKATIHGLRISEVPTTLSPDGRSKAPHLRRWRDGWRHLRFLLLFSPRWLFLYPGGFLMAMGLVAMIRLLQGPIRIDSVGLDVNTLVYCGAAIVCGFQLMVFALFATIFAINASLLPRSPRFERLTSLFSLEIGIVTGLLLILGGVVASSYAVGFWGRASFGPLDPQVSLRIVVPAATSIVLGIQVASSSFFISVLGLRSG
ncbi:MAG: glycosyltransferase family 2 protein [Gammaproteobacteria bacterium]